MQCQCVKFISRSKMSRTVQQKLNEIKKYPKNSCFPLISTTSEIFRELQLNFL